MGPVLFLVRSQKGKRTGEYFLLCLTPLGISRPSFNTASSIALPL